MTLKINNTQHNWTLSITMLCIMLSVIMLMGATTLSITTFSITTFSRTSLSIQGLYMTLSMTMLGLMTIVLKLNVAFYILVG